MRWKDIGKWRAGTASMVIGRNRERVTSTASKGVKTRGVTGTARKGRGEGE